MIYLDHAATTPIRPEAAAALRDVLDAVPGNPSGVHGVSRQAKNLLEEARERAAVALGADRAHEIVFTSGGTESDNLALVGASLAATSGRPGGVVTTAVEHEAVLASARFLASIGAEVTVVDVDRDGLIEPDAVAAAVTASTAVVSVMAANNETGVIQPVAAVAAAVRDRFPAVVVHTDAIQAFASEDITPAATGADLISLSAHKFGGPKGVGLLYVRNGVVLDPVLHGGGQEMGRRSGTPNVAGIVSAVTAMEAAVAERADFSTRIAAVRDAFLANLAANVPSVRVTAPDASKLPQHAHVRFPGVGNETLLIRLDHAGVAAGAGSACQSGAIQASHVLTAMGLDAASAGECIRFTFGRHDDLATARLAAGMVAATVTALMPAEVA